MVTKKRRIAILKKYTRAGERLAFSGRQNVSRESNLSSAVANREILSHNYSYPLHREYKRQKLFNPFFSFAPREQVQADLIDIHLLAPHNENVKFILVCIDIFSRKLWVESVRNKRAATIRDAFARILNRMGELPAAVFFDRGTEFINNLMQTLCRQRGLKVYLPNSQFKAAFAERVNRTLQSLIYRYMTEKQSNVYIDVLQDLVQTYNERKHRAFNHVFSPDEAERKENLGQVRNILFHLRGKTVLHGRKMKAKFSVGDVVRIQKERGVFGRGYNETSAKEYFRVAQVLHRLPIISYKLQSLDTNEIIDGAFYDSEIQLIKGDIFKIERVIKERKLKNKGKEYFVKWLDFGDQHNSWVKASDLQRA